MAKILLAIQVDDAIAFAEKIERVSQKKNREDTFVRATNMVQILNLLEEEKYDAVITQYQLGAVPFTAEEIFRIQRMNEKMTVIVVVPDEIKGGTFLASLLGENILNAAFGSDAKPSFLLRLVDEQRTRQDARAYYGIIDAVTTKEEANSLPAYGVTAENLIKLKTYLVAGDDQPLWERFLYIVSKVGADELVKLIGTLDRDTIDELSTHPEFEPYLSMSEMDGMRRSRKKEKKGGFLSGLFGKKGEKESGEATKDALPGAAETPAGKKDETASGQQDEASARKEDKENTPDVKEPGKEAGTAGAYKDDPDAIDRETLLSEFFGTPQPVGVRTEKSPAAPAIKPAAPDVTEREKQKAEEKKRLEMERIAKEEKIRQDAQKAIKEQSERKLEEERRRAEEEKARLLVEQNARLEEERKAREAAEKRAEEERLAREKAEAERVAKDEAEKKAREAEHARLMEEQRAKAEADRKAAEEDRALLLAEQTRKLEAERKRTEEAERKAEAEKQRLLREQEEAEKKAEAERQKLIREKEKAAEAEKARLLAEQNARLEEERKARAEAEKKAETEKQRLLKEQEERENEFRKEKERLAKEAERKAAEQQKQYAAELERERRAREEAEKKAETPVTVIQKQMTARRVIGVFGLYKGAGTAMASVSAAKTLSQYEPVTYIEIPGSSHGVFSSLDLGRKIGAGFRSVPHMIADGNMDFTTVQNMYEDINFFVANDAYGDIRLDTDRVFGMINATSDNVVIEPGCSMEEARRSGLMNCMTHVIIVYEKEQEDNYLSRIKDELDLSYRSNIETYLLAFSDRGGEPSPLAAEVLYSSARRPKDLLGVHPLELKGTDEQKFLGFFGLAQSKKMKRMKQAAIVKFMGVRDIAVFGSERGCGVTHTALMLADSVRKDYKVALLELNPTKHMEGLAKELDRYDEETKVLKLYGIDVYYGITYQEFATRYRTNYQVVVIDFGTYTNATRKREDGKSGNREIFLNCSKKYLVFDASPWRLAALDELIPRLDSDTDPERKMELLAPMTTGKGLKQYGLYQRAGGREIHCMPTSEMPVRCDGETAEFMKKLVLK